VACEGNQSELLKNGNRMAHASIAGPRMMIRARESGCMALHRLQHGETGVFKVAIPAAAVVRHGCEAEAIV
jgi:hypothetical protein